MGMENLRAVRPGVRVHVDSNLNCRDNLDDLWLLGHYSNFKSEETSFVWIWRICKKFRFWRFWIVFQNLIFFSFDQKSCGRAHFTHRFARAAVNCSSVNSLDKTYAFHYLAAIFWKLVHIDSLRILYDISSKNKTFSSFEKKIEIPKMSYSHGTSFFAFQVRVVTKLSKII